MNPTSREDGSIEEFVEILLADDSRLRFAGCSVHESIFRFLGTTGGADMSPGGTSGADMSQGGTV